MKVGYILQDGCWNCRKCLVADYPDQGPKYYCNRLAEIKQKEYYKDGFWIPKLRWDRSNLLREPYGKCKYWKIKR